MLFPHIQAKFRSFERLKKTKGKNRAHNNEGVANNSLVYTMLNKDFLEAVFCFCGGCVCNLDFV